MIAFTQRELHRVNPFEEGSSRERLSGKGICDQHCLLVAWCVTGDMQYMSDDLKFPSSNSNDPRGHCYISRTVGAAHQMIEFRPGADWNNYLKTRIEYQGSPVTSHPIDGLRNWSVSWVWRINELRTIRGRALVFRISNGRTHIRWFSRNRFETGAIIVIVHPR